MQEKLKMLSQWIKKSPKKSKIKAKINKNEDKFRFKQNKKSMKI